jgi:hypothetical protein
MRFRHKFHHPPSVESYDFKAIDDFKILIATRIMFGELVSVDRRFLEMLKISHTDLTDREVKDYDLSHWAQSVIYTALSALVKKQNDPPTQ